MVQHESKTESPSVVNQEESLNVGMTPQDSSSPSTETSDHDNGLNREKQGGSLQLNDDAKPNNANPKGGKNKKGRRLKKTKQKFKKVRKRLACVEEEGNYDIPKRRLPVHQYETIMRRRAIRKREDKSPTDNNNNNNNMDSSSSPSLPSLSGPKASPESPNSAVGTEVSNLEEEEKDAENVARNEEEFGDVSLGMKLSILGGKVIVQHLISLSDGRASPAQLTGLIQRGDVLLAIDNVSLVNIPIDQLMQALQPLSSPQVETQSYRRTLKLRFANSEGLTVLNKNESAAAARPFNLSQLIPKDLPFVDQLSGAPMFPNAHEESKSGSIGTNYREPPKDNSLLSSLKPPITPVSSIVHSHSISEDQHISLRIAVQRKCDRQRYTSEFFAWSDRFSKLLRPTVDISLILEVNEVPEMTRSEMMEHGLCVMAGAKVLSYIMEDMDKGEDTRSFRQWNSTLSVRSKMSRRTRETKGSIAITECDADSAAGGDVSSVSDEADIDPDKILLELAAHDEIWRNQVVRALEQAANELVKKNTETEIEVIDQKEDQPAPTFDDALSQEMGNLLFGVKASRIMTTKKKRSFALPPEEVTSVLYDLTKIITSSMPGEITLKGQHGNHFVTFPKSQRQSAADTNALLASRFLAQEALPTWLRSFRPLPWNQRRVLWQSGKLSTGDSQTIGLNSRAHSEDDGLTLDSDSTGFQTGASKSKSLQERIEDMELDAETREDTCDLVTFYFTRFLLKKLEVPKKFRKSNAQIVYSSTEKEIVQFVEQYGAYLELHRCLVGAAEVESDSVIAVLLRLARKDIRHEEAMKEVSRANVLIIYEAAMLSAILKRLRGIRQEVREEYRSALLTLCVSAFPDVRPWQVRLACLRRNAENKKEGSEGLDEDNVNDMYYDYLSQLLHPSEGHEMARRDKDLVREWCILSAHSASDVLTTAETRLKNFHAVASVASSEHRMYHRDIVLLMNLSMDTVQHNLALDLASEIVQSSECFENEQNIFSMMAHLRHIAKKALKVKICDPGSMDISTLSRILRLFHVIESKFAIASSQSPHDKIPRIIVSDELYQLLLVQRCGHKIATAADPPKKELAFMDLLVRVAMPLDVLQMLLQWTNSDSSPRFSLPIIRKTLLRGAQLGVHDELSGSLLRIRQARLRSRKNMKEVWLESDDDSSSNSTDDDFTVHRDGGIWRKMHRGTAIVDK